MLHVRRSLSQVGYEINEPKTKQGRRDVLLFEDAAQVLREHRLASSFAGDDALVFPTEEGTPQLQGNVRKRGLCKAAERAGINMYGLTFHSLRDTFASTLIFDGADVAFVSAQLGHASSDVTHRHYIGLFNQRDQGEKLRQRRGERLERSRKDEDGNGRQETAEREAEIVALEPKPPPSNACTNFPS